MQNSHRSFLASLLFSLMLTMSVFAGNSHCPDAPPPPDEGDRSVSVTEDINHIVKGFWDFIAHTSEVYSAVVSF